MKRLFKFSQEPKGQILAIHFSRTLVELALASGHGPVSAALIAKRQNLSVAYLEQLLHRLKKHRLVVSIRGPRGGYVLSRDSRTITMAEVVRVLDETNGMREYGGRGQVIRIKVRNGKRFDVPTTVAADHSPRKTGRISPDSPEVSRHGQWIAEAVWRCVHERLMQSLDAVTLQDLCEEARAISGEPLDHRYVFHI
jgi:Rrf2 family protein